MSDEDEAGRWTALTKRIREESEVKSFTTYGPDALGNRDILDLVGRVNTRPFLGYPPGTVRLDGCRSISAHLDGEWHFSRRKRPWNEVLTREGKWVDSATLASGPFYESADFDGLPTGRGFG